MQLTVRTSRFAERQRQLLTMLTDFNILFFTKKTQTFVRPKSV